MAENASIISKEDRNFWILNILIQYVAPTAVRKVFNDKIPPKDLADILNRNVKIIQDLVNKKVIKTHEQEVLTRIPGFKLPSMPSSPNKTATSSEDFDVTLMICILRNLNFVQPPPSGWDKLPPVGDNSLGANLTRIKEHRNTFCHSSKTKINDKKFKRLWSSLTHTFSEISCGETDNIVFEIQSFDYEGCDIKNLLCKIQKELRDIRGDMQFYQNWKVNTANVLDDWRVELESFYETRGTRTVIERLYTNNAVMIIGNSGIGKTATMRYVSLLFEKKGYQVVLISSPDEIPLHRFPERKQLFIMDDIIGKYRVDSVAVELWRKFHDRLKVVFKDTKVKLLSTLRRQLYIDMSSILFPTVFSSTIVDLESNNLVFSSNEKKAMLENYIKRRNIAQNFDDDEMLRICSSQIAFPLLSNLFTSNPKFLNMKSTFFHSPSMIFKEELNRLQIENKKVYCVLVLVVMFTIEELHMIFDINCEIERIEAYNKILRACEIPENIARKTLHRHVQSVAGTFVETNNIFKFQHDKLEETIACHFGSQFPHIMLKHCKLDFIRDRVRLTSMPKDDENIFILKQPLFDVFSERVIDEIRKGKFRDILLSEPMQCEKFIHKFASYLKRNQTALKYIETALCTETFLPPQQHEKSNYTRVLSVANRFALLEELQSRKKRFIHWVAAMGSVQLFTLFYKIPEKKYSRTFLTHLLHLAVSGENFDVVKLLIDEGGQINLYDEVGIPLLCKIARTNRCDIAELLIDKGADVNQTDQILGWTPCHVASWFNEAEMLTFLLSRGCSINAFNFQLKVPLAIAVIRNNTEAVSVLLENGAEIYNSLIVWESEFAIQTNFNVVLEVALNINNQKIIRMLTDNLKHNNLITMAFPVAIRKKDISRKLVNIFLAEMRSVDLKSSLWKDFLELCEAIYNNDIPRIENILAKGEEIDIYSFLRGVSSIKHRRKILCTFDDNYLRFCPLHVSATCDNTKAAKILIQNGADPFQRDVNGRTSLHLASSRAMLNIFLSTNNEPKPLSTNSFFSQFKCVFKFLISLEIVPFVFTSFANRQCDSKANVRDKNGNTPLHSIIIRMRDPTECLDSVETLIENGADINLRCKSGYLPIDHFKTVLLRFDEATIDRGECLLGGNQNKSFLNKEKWYFGVLAAAFITLYISLSLNFAKLVCFLVGKHFSSYGLEQYYFYRIDLIQVIYLFLLHRHWHDFVMIIQVFLVYGVDLIPLRRKLYSDKLFVRFSEKVGLGFLLVRLVAIKFDFIYSANVFFNVYCVLICTFFCIMYIPYQNREWIQKHHGNLVIAFKTTFVGFLSLWILYLLLMIKFNTQTYTQDIVEGYLNWLELLYFFIVKVVVSYIFIVVFIFRLYQPLLNNILQPVHLYRHYFSHLMSLAYLIFLIFEILLVPLMLLFCDILNC